MNKDKKDIPNIDFECIPEGDCWCKGEEYKLSLPEQKDNKICYSPRELKKIIDKLKNVLFISS